MNTSTLQLDAPSPLYSERTTALFDYLRTMREASEAQRQVMLTYLGAVAGAGAGTSAGTNAAAVLTGTPARTLPAARASSAAAISNRKVTRTSRPAKPTVAPTAGMSTLDALVMIVSERTGYPKEMLDQDLDMEADLGIDSIKRIEILGQLRDRLGLGGMSQGARSDALEELARVKTMRKIAEWLDARAAKTAAEAPASGASPVSEVRQLRGSAGGGEQAPACEAEIDKVA